MNIVLNIDDEVIKKSPQNCTPQNTTLAAMVKDYLTSVANADVAKRPEQDAHNTRNFKELLASCPLDGIDLTRTREFPRDFEFADRNREMKKIDLPKLL